MNLSGFEKSAAGIGDSLKKLYAMAMANPKRAAAITATVAGAGFILNSANKARGLHQIVNEAGKRDVMNYQTTLLKDIAQELKESRMAQASRPSGPMPIIPPLR